MSTPKIYRSIYPPAFIPTNLSLSQYLDIYNPDAVSDDKIILEDDWTGKSLSYHGIRNRAAEHAHALRSKLGLKEGDVVAICAANSVDHVQFIHAVLWTGAVTAPISTLSTVDDFVHCFEICRPRCLVVEGALLTKAGAALGRIPDLGEVNVVIIGNEGPDELLQYPRDFESLEKSPIYDLAKSDNREHTAVICFSSGTSGKPKGVELSHYNLIASLACIRSSDPLFYNAESRSVFFAPLCHIYGLQTMAILTPFLGVYTMIMKTFTLDAFLRLSSRTKADTLRIVPPVAFAMAKYAEFENFDLTAVKYILCSGAALKDDIIHALHKILNDAPIFQGYGRVEMTESISGAILRPCESHKVGSVGRLLANLEARLVDGNMKDVEAGEEGEMLLRGPTIFRRYMNDPKSTEEAFDQGWMKTGDILRVDSDGFFYLIERKKEMIKYNGRQVAPAELEGILISHPFVSEGTVCAKWDESRGTEVPMAYVTLSQSGKMYDGGIQAALDAVRKFVDDKVAPYKKLRGGVEILDEIPKTASGKILRRLLPARLEMHRRSKI